jgi:hypothetical protein
LYETWNICWSTRGYRQKRVWRHPQRMAIFSGDLVDRGPRIRERWVRDEPRPGETLCIMVIMSSMPSLGARQQPGSGQHRP